MCFNDLPCQIGWTRHKLISSVSHAKLFLHRRNLARFNPTFVSVLLIWICLEYLNGHCNFYNRVWLFWNAQFPNSQYLFRYKEKYHRYQLSNSWFDQIFMVNLIKYFMVFNLYLPIFAILRKLIDTYLYLSFLLLLIIYHLLYH